MAMASGRHSLGRLLGRCQWLRLMRCMLLGLLIWQRMMMMVLLLLLLRLLFWRCVLLELLHHG